MSIIVDSSVAGAWLLPDEENRSAAVQVVERLEEENAIVPALFWYEIRNVLLQAKRRNRIDRQNFETSLIQLRDEFAPLVDNEQEEAQTFDLAERHTLTVYDAVYLETALRRGAELATFDRALANAAARENVVNPALSQDNL